MQSLKRAIKYLITDRLQFCDSFVKNVLSFLPDRLYLSLRFRCQMGTWINWKNPTTFSEKLQWLKVYNRRPEYTKMVDKYAVKQYVADLIGKEYIIPTLGVWDSPELIDWEALPNQFVLKTTNGGGGNGVVICQDKSSLDKTAAANKMKTSLKSNIYKTLREWPYKNVTKRIIAEELLVPSDGDLKDYKVLCFNGKAKLIEYHSGRFSDNHTQDIYDQEWNLTDITQSEYGEISHNMVDKPEFLNEMLDLSEKLAAGIPHVRVDWYNCENRLYFGEITFFDGSGLVKFDKIEHELMLGSWIDCGKV